MSKNKTAIAVIATFLLIACAGIFLFDKGLKKNTSDDFITTSSCPAEKWIDTHVHIETAAAFENLEARMDENGVSCSLGFIYIDPEDPADSIEILNEDYKGSLNRIYPLFFVTPKSPTDANTNNLDTIRAEDKGFFKGHGELAFYREPFLKSHLIDPNWKSLFKYSEDNDYWLMIHLRGPQQLKELESTLTSYPTAKVLLHGPELHDDLPRLLVTYPNLYYTLDTATLLIKESSTDGAFSKVLMYEPTGKIALTTELKQNRRELLANAKTKWLPIIEAAPEKVFWGTDISTDWHFDKDIYNELVEFSKEFASPLSNEQQAKYFYLNAKEVLFD